MKPLRKTFWECQNEQLNVNESCSYFDTRRRCPVTIAYERSPFADSFFIDYHVFRLKRGKKQNYKNKSRAFTTFAAFPLLSPRRNCSLHTAFPSETLRADGSSENQPAAGARLAECLKLISYLISLSFLSSPFGLFFPANW